MWSRYHCSRRLWRASESSIRYEISCKQALIMAILGLGTDIVEITRGAAATTIWSDCRSSVDWIWNGWISNPWFSRPLPCPTLYDKRGLCKDLRYGNRSRISFQHIEIRNDDYGKPLLILMAADEKLGGEGRYHTFLSISDEQQYAVATVVIESA